MKSKTILEVVGIKIRVIQEGVVSPQGVWGTGAVPVRVQVLVQDKWRTLLKLISVVVAMMKTKTFCTLDLNLFEHEILCFVKNHLVHLVMKPAFLVSVIITASLNRPQGRRDLRLTRRRGWEWLDQAAHNLWLHQELREV